jgi:DNA-binding MurR/RpiR family transcriptional regulator
MTDTTFFAAGGPDAPEPVEDWLRMLTRERQLSRAAHDVIQSAITHPELASYASALEFSGAAKVNIATVTRTAQALGFSGWPELRQEIRARYLSALTAPEVAIVHSAHSSGQPFDEAINRDIENLGSIRKTLDRRRVQQLAKFIAESDRRLILASGSSAAIARALVHNASLAGYRSELLDDAVVVSNALTDLRAGDILIAIAFWRLYRSTSLAVRQAKALGATVCIIADTAASPLAQLADSVLVVPAEGVSFFPSLVAGLAVVEGICAELARLDPQRTGEAIASAERQWKEFGLLHFSSN